MNLQPGMDAHEFRNYYFLKEELVQFCRENQLSAAGGKQELTDRIAIFLKSGVRTKPEPKKTCRGRENHPQTEITEDTLIEPDFVCSERHREFFKGQIGAGFSFKVAFQKWLKTHTGQTYRDAVHTYYEIQAESRTKKTVIDRQFEYNTYIRDFFADNQGKSLAEAIECWNYKKRRPGHNRYEPGDLPENRNDSMEEKQT